MSQTFDLNKVNKIIFNGKEISKLKLDSTIIWPRLLAPVVIGLDNGTTGEFAVVNNNKNKKLMLHIINTATGQEVLRQSLIQKTTFINKLGNQNEQWKFYFTDGDINSAELTKAIPYNISYLAVESRTQIAGRGGVAIGKIQSGIFKVNDSIKLLKPTGQQVSSTISGIEINRKMTSQAVAGDTCSILCRGVAGNAIGIGDILTLSSDAQYFSRATKLKVQIALKPKEGGGRSTPIVSNYRPSLLFHNKTTSTIISWDSSIYDKPQIAPGEFADVYMTVSAGIICRPGEYGVLKEGNREVGNIIILDIIN